MINFNENLGTHTMFNFEGGQVGFSVLLAVSIVILVLFV